MDAQLAMVWAAGFGALATMVAAYFRWGRQGGNGDAPISGLLARIDRIERDIDGLGAKVRDNESAATATATEIREAISDCRRDLAYLMGRVDVGGGPDGVSTGPRGQVR